MNIQIQITRLANDPMTFHRYYFGIWCIFFRFVAFFFLLSQLSWLNSLYAHRVENLLHLAGERSLIRAQEWGVTRVVAEKNTRKMLMKRWFIVHQGNIWQWILFLMPKSVLIMECAVCPISCIRPLSRHTVSPPCNGTPNGITNHNLNK